MTDEQLAQIQLLHSRTSTGKWHFTVDTDDRPYRLRIEAAADTWVVANLLDDDESRHPQQYADFAFIEAAHSAIPQLLQEIATLKGILHDMQLDSTAYHLGIAEGRRQVLEAAKAQADKHIVWTELDTFVEKWSDYP